MDRFPVIHRAFHPKDPACGTRNYDIGALNEYQKRNLNVRKDMDRDVNEIYLGMHPEIKALISVLLKDVLCKRPDMNVHEIIGSFFNRPRRRIFVDVLRYFLQSEQAFGIETELQMLANNA